MTPINTLDCCCTKKSISILQVFIASSIWWSELNCSVLDDAPWFCWRVWRCARGKAQCQLQSAEVRKCPAVAVPQEKSNSFILDIAVITALFHASLSAFSTLYFLKCIYLYVLFKKYFMLNGIHLMKNTVKHQYCKILQFKITLYFNIF